MKKIVYLVLVILFASLLAACAPAAPKTGELIKPGDQIGDFLFTTGEEGNVTYTWGLGCEKQGSEENYACKSTVGTKVNLSVGIYDDTLSGKLDEVWSGHTYELIVENRPVDLKAFGFIDTSHPKVGKMRHWNVVVVAAKPGKLTLRDSGKVKGDAFGSTTTYIFSAP